MPFKNTIQNAQTKRQFDLSIVLMLDPPGPTLPDQDLPKKSAQIGYENVH